MPELCVSNTNRQSVTLIMDDICCKFLALTGISYSNHGFMNKSLVLGILRLSSHGLR